MEQLRGAGVTGAVIGEIVAGAAGRIEVKP